MYQNEFGTPDINPKDISTNRLVCLLVSVSNLCLCVLFREILLRVSEVVVVFCFTHLFDAVAVRYFFSPWCFEIRSKITQTIAQDEEWEVVFAVSRAWRAASSGEPENSWSVLCATWWATTSSASPSACPWCSQQKWASWVRGSHFRNTSLDWKLCLLLKRRFEELMFLLSVKGLWTGLTICVLMQSIFFLLYLAKLDWKKAADDVCIPVPRQNCPVSFSVRCTWF